MVNRVLVLVAALAGPAFAQTPTVVSPPPSDTVAPWIQQRGNLRLSVACGEVIANSPEDGLEVRVDGVPFDAQRVAGWGAGYLIAPGHHHIEVSAPGCEASTFDVDADPLRSTHATGRLVLDDWGRGGTAGSPNGGGLTVGAWFEPVPHGPGSNAIFNQTATYDDSNTARGAFLSVAYEHRYYMTAFDVALAGGSSSGFVAGASAEPAERFTASVFDNLYQFRLGARLPLHDASLAAGTGIGFDWWITSGKLATGASDLFAPDGPDASFYFPMWASATVKATCEWGVQALGQYDLHPASPTAGGFSFGAGIIYEPSAACHEAPGVLVTN